MELTVEKIKKDQLSYYASGRCIPYTLLNDRIDFLLSELDKRTPSPSACKASPSGCKSESVEKVIAAAINYQAERKHRSLGINRASDLIKADVEFTKAVAAHQKDSE